MFNPYSIILGLFVVTGLLTTAWGLRIISLARKTLQWPTVKGVIDESRVSSDASEMNDLLPHIKFSYLVDQKEYQQLLKFSGDITPSEEFSKSYVEKYPVGSSVQVYYDPDHPEIATLEPGPAQGDWLVLAIGLCVLVFGIVLFIFAG